MEKLKRFVQLASNFLRQDVWNIEPIALPGLRRLFVRAARVVHLVFRGFKRDQCMLHASSLTFTTLLAIIPVLALALSMARVFGGADLARDQLKALTREWLSAPPPSWIPGAAASDAPGGKASATTETGGAAAAELSAGAPVENGGLPAIGAADARSPSASATAEEGGEAAISVERVENLIDTGFDRVDSINFKALGGLGIIFLLSTVIGVLGQVEAAFNRVWGVTEHRPLHRKFTDYLSVLIVVPFLITAASSIPAVNMVAKLTSGQGMPPGLPAFWLRFMRGSGAVLLLSLSFAFMLRFLPNTRVGLRSGLAGGIVTALFSLGWLRVCAALQIGVARNSIFFGSFAVVPILLSWVYVNWGILLFGAEVSFAVQNADTFRMEQGARKAALRTRLIAAVDLLATAARSMLNGGGLLNVSEYVAERRVSVRLVNDVVHELTQRGLLVETAQESGVFALRREVSSLTVGEVFRTLLDTGVPAEELGYSCGPESILSDPLDDAIAKILPQSLSSIGPDTFRNKLKNV